MAIASSNMRPHYDPDRHHRRSIRLKGYDYSREGLYFVTICAQNRECLFGEVVEDAMRLNDAGRTVQTVWDELPDHYPGVGIDAFVVMPNHIHGIIVLTTPPPDVSVGRDESVGMNTDAVVGAGPRACPYPTPPRMSGHPTEGHPVDSRPPAHSARSADAGQPGTPTPGQPRGVAPTGLSVGDVVHRFKTSTTKRYADGVKQHGWPPFPGRLWQRNYYEHIIRDDVALNRIRQYIIDNPRRWAEDPENPSAPGRMR